MKRGRRRRRVSTFTAGLLGILFVVAISYGAYTKFGNPFASPYTAHVIFANANGLRPDSAVRVAGVNVGKVTSVAPVSSCKLSQGNAAQSKCAAADVTM